MYDEVTVGDITVGDSPRQGYSLWSNGVHQKYLGKHNIWAFKAKAYHFVGWKRVLYARKWLK